MTPQHAAETLIAELRELSPWLKGSRRSSSCYVRFSHLIDGIVRISDHRRVWKLERKPRWELIIRKDDDMAETVERIYALADEIKGVVP